MLCVGWERNLSGSEASFTDGSSYVSELFFFSFIIGFVEVAVEGCGVRLWVPQSCFLPPESRAGPGRFQPCGPWVEPSFTFPGAVGVSRGRLLDLAALLCLRKENHWIPVNWIATPSFSENDLWWQRCVEMLSADTFGLCASRHKEMLTGLFYFTEVATPENLPSFVLCEKGMGLNEVCLRERNLLTRTLVFKMCLRKHQGARQILSRKVVFCFAVSWFTMKSGILELKSMAVFIFYLILGSVLIFANAFLQKYWF